MNIQQFRASFPQYNDMSDKQLADALYKKDYTDMPRAEFNQKFLGKSDVSSAQMHSEVAKQNPFMADHPALALGKRLAGDVGHGIAQGAADLGYGLWNLSGDLAGALGGQNDHVPVPNYTEQAKDPRLAKAAAFGTTFLAPEVRGAGLLAKGAEKLLPFAGKAASKAVPALNAGLTGATYGGIYSANGNNSRDSVPSSMVDSGLLAGLTHGLIRTPKVAANAALSLLAKNAPNKPEDVAKLAQMVGDLPVDLPSLAGSNSKKLYTRNLALVPFSGNAQAMQKVVDGTNSHALSVLSQLKGDTPESDIRKNIATAIQNNYLDRKQTSKQLYKKAQDLADSSGFKMNGTPNLQGAISSIDDPLLPAEVNRLLQGSEGPLSKAMNSNASLQDAQRAKSYLGEKSADAKVSGDLPTHRVLSMLSGSLNQDINDALASHPNQEVNAAYQAANDHFKNEVVPYRHSSVWGIANGSKDNPKGLAAQIMSNQTPEMRKVANDLPQQVKHNVVYDGISNLIKEDAQGKHEISAANLARKYSTQLTPDAKQLLLSPHIRHQFNKLLALNNIADEYRVAEKPPETGALWAKMAKQASLYGAPSMAFYHGNLPLAASMAISAPIMARAAGKALRSKRLRDAYINGGLDRVLAPGSKPALAADAAQKILGPRQIGYMVGGSNGN